MSIIEFIEPNLHNCEENQLASHFPMAGVVCVRTTFRADVLGVLLDVCTF